MNYYERDAKQEPSAPLTIAPVLLVGGARKKKWWCLLTVLPLPGFLPPLVTV
jgi:hypothetical protein